MTRYPLAWPTGWPRKTAAQRTEARFAKNDRRVVRYSDGGESSWITKKALTVSDGVRRVLVELERLGVGENDTVISTNVPTRLDGLPRSGAREPDDPGVAVYWQAHSGARRVMAIDRYTTVADNLAAIAATLEAMRAIERHGGAQILDRAFTGFTALPSPAAARSWREIIGVPPGERDISVIRAVYRRRAQDVHPDRGGSHDAMAELTAAMRRAEMEVGGTNDA
ncbi:hypothetical protein K7G19_21140 [Cupriavidus sp. DB3]|uniref:hypothetical protein n=1 Tax=Cupriavidus sp. DB3 TaxID=2873259 RepID=UPI001CF59F82|nr:hypothetical protein [Cupriavidus sp. DB3]MCA7086100.1 hypothetical protein [Cupriavidus sp. DB3]